MSTKREASSLELGQDKSRKDNEKAKLKARDVLGGMIIGYVVGMLLMMVIHFLVSKTCTNCIGGTTTSGVQTDCYEGWIILAGENTCFFDSYFNVNWTVIEIDAGTNEIDVYFNKIETLQDVDDDILIGAVFQNDRGFYQWIDKGNNGPPLPGNATDTCVADLETTPTEWGLKMLAIETEGFCPARF